MFANSVWRATAIRCGMVLALALVADGCQQQPGVQPHVTGKKTKPIYCDQKVDVDPQSGTKQKAVYVCSGDSLTWEGHGHGFDVEFQSSPFQSGVTSITDKNQDPTKQVINPYSDLEVFKYSITVDSSLKVDPQVVAGGNP